MLLLPTLVFLNSDLGNEQPSKRFNDANHFISNPPGKHDDHTCALPCNLHPLWSRLLPPITSSRSGPLVVPNVSLPRNRTVTGAFGGSHAESSACRRLLANLVAPRNVSPSCVPSMIKRKRGSWEDRLGARYARGTTWVFFWLLLCRWSLSLYSNPTQNLVLVRSTKEKTDGKSDEQSHVAY